MFRQARSASKPQEAQNTAFLNRICRKTPRSCHENLVFFQFLGLLYTSPLIDPTGGCEQYKLRKMDHATVVIRVGIHTGNKI